MERTRQRNGQRESSRGSLRTWHTAAHVNANPHAAMLAPNDVKEELSIAYVHAVCTRAGYSVAPGGKDRDSIDLQVRARGSFPRAALMSPMLDLQLKATAIDLAPYPDTFPFDLPVNNYKALIGRTAVPRLLVIFAMPPDESDWLNWTEDAVVLRRAAYYLNLKGMPATENATTQRVHLRRANVFNPETVRVLLERVANEEEL